jgi:hypothetical protein
MVKGLCVCSNGHHFLTAVSFLCSSAAVLDVLRVRPRKRLRATAGLLQLEVIFVLVQKLRNLWLVNLAQGLTWSSPWVRSWEHFGTWGIKKKKLKSSRPPKEDSSRRQRADCRGEGAGWLGPHGASECLFSKYTSSVWHATLSQRRSVARRVADDPSSAAGTCSSHSPSDARGDLARGTARLGRGDDTEI